ncbi:MAG: DUF4328 domain-containing protein [Archangium sp.]|nr:DUF4328 domain-containing protein [Archangium sp.]MDP3576319.1 DUF4328 domain-containing protein [Archangium sp.]
MTLSSMCAVHPNAPSVVTCRRCGRFCCTNCLPQFETCPECVARATISVPPIEGRATVAMVALIASVGMHALMAAVACAQLATGDVGEEGVLAIVGGLVALLYLVVFITTIVLVCMWFHLATRHALARGASMEVETPAAAVGSWFIPFVNLARPFNLVRRMLDSAGLDAGAVSAWQVLWITGNITANISSRVGGMGGIGIGLLSDLFMVGAGITFVQIIRKLKWPPAAALVS